MKDLENSQGSVSSEYERYMDSTEAKVKQFKEEVSQVWTNLISSDLTRGIMDSLNTLIKVFGNGKTLALGLATAIGFIFKGKVGNDLISSFKNLTTKIIEAKTNGELLSKTIGKIGKTQLLLGGLTAGLMVFDLIKGKINETKEEMANLNKETIEGFTKSSEEISNAENLLSQKQELESKLSDNNLTSSQQVDLKQQLYDIERKIADILPDSTSLYDEQGKKIADNTQLIKDQIEAKKQALVSDASKVLDTDSKGNFFGIGKRDNFTQIQEARALKKTIDSYNNSEDNTFDKYTYSSATDIDTSIKHYKDKSKEMISDIQKDYDDALKNMSEKRLAILQMQSQGIDNEEIGNRLGMSVDSFLSAYNELTKVEEKAKDVKNTDLSVEKMFGNTDDINKINEQIRTTKEIIGDLGDESGTRSQQIEDYKNSLSDVFKDTFKDSDVSTGAKITDLSSVISQLQKDGELTTQSISNLAKALPELNLNGKPAEEQITLLREAIDKLKNSSEDINTNAIKESQKSLGENIALYEKIAKYKKEIKDSGNISSSLMREFYDENGSFADFMGNPTDISQVTDYLNSKINEVSAKYAEAQDVLNANNTEYYQNVLQTGELTNEKIKEWASNFMDVNSESYNFDLNNYRTIEQAKQGIIELLSQSFAKVCSDMTGIGVEEYEKDMSNYTTIQEAKQGVAQKLGQAVSQFLTDTLNISADTYSLDYQNFKNVQEAKSKCLEVLEKQLDEMNDKVGQDYINMATYNKSVQAQFENKPWIPEDQKKYKNQLQAQWDKDVKDRKLIQNKIEEIEKLGVPDLNRNIPSFDPDKNSNGTSSGSGSGNKDNSKKTISKIEEEIDRYHDLKETIETTKQSLDSLSNANETAFRDNKINLINQEIDKYSELARKENNLLLAYKNRMNEVRNALRGRGITFDGNGAMTNYYSLLTSVENSLNNQMNADNQKALQEQWKILKKLADEYTSLYENDIPNATKAINDANKNIYNSRKELLDSMMNSETKVSDIIKKSINDEIELREKQLEALQKLHEEEKQGEKLAKNEEDLIKLRNQMDKVEGVDNKKYAELKQQYDELLQTSNSDIRDDVYDKQNKALEEEKNKYDELMNDADRMTKLVQDALNTGVVTIFGETKNIQEEMVKLVNEENIGLQNRANNLKEINDLLRESKSIMSQISSIDNQLGLSGYISKVTPSNTNTINLGNSTYNISGMDENKVRNIVEKEMNSSFERIAKQLGLKI